MSLVASSISGAAYVVNNAEDKDTGNGFEFTRRKRWPQLLLQELVGATLFCLKPTIGSRGSVGSANEGRPSGNGWKVMYVSPSVSEMLGPRPSDVEGREFFDYVYAADQPQLTAMLTSLLIPSLSHKRSNTSSESSNTPSTTMLPQSTSSASHTTYIRMLTDLSPSRPGSSKGHHKLHSGNSGSSSGSGSSGSPTQTTPRTVVWEVRAHATGVEGADMPAFGLGGAGTMVPQSGGDEMKGKAVWVMGRRVGEAAAEGEGNGQNLDAFLELKLENEKLREELRELQIDFDDDDYRMTNTYVDAIPSRSFNAPSSSSSPAASSSSSSPASSPAYPQPKFKPGPGRPPKDKETRDKDKEGREKKRAKKASMAGAGGAEAGEGMHVCVTCGRTDSPEWRKGPLGPKTLCNACGLRWAKRNSTAPTRKDKKAASAAAVGK